ncbi:hypothetical protein F4778DRAFT_728975 [Xylariomycetidae sp. FL2044]|nr:hypothetical protein F4778DRAFT_728975 [Xylariomycetidae sp. FL2044]
MSQISDNDDLPSRLPSSVKPVIETSESENKLQSGESPPRAKPTQTDTGPTSSGKNEPVMGFDPGDWLQRSYSMLLTALEQGRKADTLHLLPNQALLHLTSTERRIATLENQLRTMKQDLYNLPEDQRKMQQKKKINHDLVYNNVLQFSNPTDFRISARTHEVPPEELPSLEVLCNEQMNGKVNLPSPTGLDKFGAKSHQWPEQLRIRYSPLISYLSEITRLSVFPSPTYGPPPGVSKKPSGVVILRPFKLLCLYEDKIRQGLSRYKATTLGKSRKDPSEIPRSDSRDSSGEDSWAREVLEKNLELLVEFLDTGLSATLDLRRQIKDGTATEIAYADLWHLFHVGGLVLISSDISHAYRVVNFVGGREVLTDRVESHPDLQRAPLDGFMIDCISLEFDGSNYVPNLVTISIRPFVGHQAITSLAVYPMKFHPDAKVLGERLTEQGTRYLELTKAPFCHMLMTGKTLDEPPHEVDSPVIVDMNMAFNSMSDEQRPDERVTEECLTEADRRETQLAPYCEHGSDREGCCGSDVIFKDLKLDQTRQSVFMRNKIRLFAPRTAAELDADDLFLLPSWVYGFVLRSRRWVKMRLCDLSDVTFDNDFNALLLPKRHKETIQAMVKVHENARIDTLSGVASVGSGIDIVRGKGSGLVFLLHGEPGVGKTSTAECVADDTKRPLFPVTCGDIGETAIEVETNLHKNFGLAQKWGCVLLLDEADVFLAKRNKTDLRRNAVVSVFLRSLEYYSGILFLTTNRVGGIDPAFKSRIHMSLFYPQFNLEYTLKLYDVFIKRARTEQEKTGSFLFKIKDKEIKKFAKKHYRQLEREGIGAWNGRQIRNAFQAAIALAEHKSQQKRERQDPDDSLPTLGEEQFSIVAESSREFERYLISTLGGTDADMAKQDHLRADRYLSSQPEPTAVARGYRAMHKSARTGVQQQVSRDPESESDSDDDSDDDDDNDDDSDMGDFGRVKKAKGKGKAVATPSATSKAEAGKTDIDMDRFEEFMRFKRYESQMGK